MPQSLKRGNLTGRLRMAAEYAESRMATLVRGIDQATETSGSPPLGGGVLSRQDFRSLVTGDPAFQQRLGARMLFASDQEKAALKRAVERAIGEVAASAPAAPEPPVGPTGPPPAPETGGAGGMPL